MNLDKRKKPEHKNQPAQQRLRENVFNAKREELTKHRLGAHEEASDLKRMRQERSTQPCDAANLRLCRC